jgi:MFS family permease
MQAPTVDDYPVPRWHAHCALALLFLLMAFDFIDRQVLASLLPAIKADWTLSDTQLGMLVSAVNVAIALLALPTAVVVDRWSRTRSIGLMAVIWSLATAACALAGSFAQLLVARFMVGAGEAGYSAGGNSLLAGLYPARLRATVVGIFQSAGVLGTVVGVVLGGFIAARWGWRAAFGVVAIPGLLLAVLAFFLKDYKTVAVTVQDKASGTARDAPWIEVITMIFRSPVLLILFVGEAAQLFFVSTLGNWLPSFFNRVHGLELGPAGVRTGAALLVSAIGVALGGLVIDKLADGRPHRRLYGAAVFALLTSAMFIAAFNLPAGAMQSALIYGGAFFMVAVLGPVMSAVMDLVHPGMRTSAMGAMITTTNLFGMALGPTAAGMLADRYDLQTALLIVSFMPLLGAAGYFVAGIGYGRVRLNAGAALCDPV